MLLRQQASRRSELKPIYTINRCEDKSLISRLLQGEAMKLSSYESEWWDSNVSHKNSVMMVQIRSTYPTTIFAMGFIAVNINTLATVRLIKLHLSKCF